jgi:hypothetical protein
MSLPFVGEKEIGHPDFVGIRQRQIFDFACLEENIQGKDGL